jgi:hypothetical protein
VAARAAPRRHVVHLIGAAVVASRASAAKPTIERIDVDTSFSDLFLTEECGVAVTTRAVGHVILRAFPGTGIGAAQVNTVNLVLTATAGGNTYRFRDVGADLVRVELDGTAILMLIGQLPFDFTGVLKIDLETGESILEPRHSIGDRVDAACAVLNP